MDSRRALPVAAVAAAASLAVLNLSCGGGQPTTSTPTTTLAPTPTPTASVAPVSACSLGKGVTYPACSHTETQLLEDVDRAMNRLVKEKPGIFDLSNEKYANTKTYKVVDKEAYLDGLVATLVAMGLCAERDVDDPDQQMIRVKNSNEFSEDFDVLLKDDYIRRGPASYAATCTPPSFPAARPPNAPPVGSGCYRPFPPPLYKMNCKVHLNAGDHHVLDSTPIVANAAYCGAVGFPDKGQCPVRPEGWSDRLACENWVVGTAKDTGREGPTWTKTADGSYCTGKESGCANSPDSQYQLWVYEGGTYRVSGNKDDGAAACDKYVDR
jgi:hypothetical protein